MLSCISLDTATKYSALQGDFTSPGYPNNYPNNALQNYHIKINQNGSIEINFEVFDLEFSSTCRYDYVKIYHVIGSSQILAATYCGKDQRKRAWFIFGFPAIPSAKHNAQSVEVR